MDSVAKQNKCRNNDHWTPEGFFIHYDKKYAVTKNLRTICLGPMVTAKTPPDNDIKPQALQEVVAKPIPKDNIPPQDIQAQQTEVLQHKKNVGGRPIKEGSVHRTTEWRRRKKKYRENCRYE
jgi:hypothetical protein